MARPIVCARTNAGVPLATSRAKHQNRNVVHRPEYKAYYSMLDRCYNPSAQMFEGYGARGITVCERWLKSFQDFIADMGPRPSTKHSIDRIDNNGNYEPTNCRWATPAEQANNKRNTVFLTYRGRTQNLRRWAKELGISRSALRTRMDAGLTGDDLFIPAPTKRLITFNGQTKHLAEWSKETGIKRGTISRRLNCGWSVEKALTFPVANPPSAG